MILSLALTSALMANQYNYVGVAKHESMIYGVSWVDDVAHSASAPEYTCTRSDSGKLSQCYIALSEGAHLPYGTEYVDLRFKIKIWSAKGEAGYCLAYLYETDNNLKPFNHFEHAEMWFGTEQRRVIDYTTARFKLNYGKVVIGVGKEMKGCQIDVAVYLEGYGN